MAVAAETVIDISSDDENDEGGPINIYDDDDDEIEIVALVCRDCRKATRRAVAAAARAAAAAEAPVQAASAASSAASSSVSSSPSAVPPPLPVPVSLSQESASSSTTPSPPSVAASDASASDASASAAADVSTTAAGGDENVCTKCGAVIEHTSFENDRYNDRYVVGCDDDGDGGVIASSVVTRKRAPVIDLEAEHAAIRARWDAQVAASDPSPSPPAAAAAASPASGSVIRTCPICLDGMSSGNMASTTCGHVFCYDCIKETQQKLKKCPQCRKKLLVRDYHRLYM